MPEIDVQKEDVFGARSLSFVSEKAGNVTIQLDRTGAFARGVTLLSPGTWTDSGVGTPLHYGEKVLSEFAANWKGNGLWDRHTGGMPRPITAKIGQIVNPRYEDGVLKGDLYFHLRTQESRDSFELLKAGMDGAMDPISFSIEHNGKESFDPLKRVYEAISLEFYGGALVDVGASGGTKILSRLDKGINDELELAKLDNVMPENRDKREDGITNSESETPGGNIMDEETTKAIDSLIARITALEDAGKALSEKPKEEAKELEPAPEVAKPEDVKMAELSKKLDAMTTQVGDLEKKVVELSKQPAPRELSVVPSAEPDAKRVTVNGGVVVNKKDGTVGKK